MKNNDLLKRKIKGLEEENNVLKQIIAHMPANVYWKNTEGYYQGCNKNIANVIGLSHESEIVGKTVYDLSTPTLAKKIDATDKKIMRGKKEVTFEEQGLDFARRAATYLSIKAPLFDKSQTVSGLVCVSIDITKIKEAEKVLVEAKNKAEEASRVKSEFVNTVEHDIRAPFSGIYAMSSLLAQNETDPEKKEALESIARSSKASLDHATQLLSFAKIEKDFNQIVLKSFSVKKLIQSVIEMQKPFAQAKKLKLIAKVDVQVPHEVVSDPGRLRGTLVNLVNNAIKFTSEGQINIGVDVSRKKYLRFSVKDTGSGIDINKQVFMNKKFFSDNTRQEGLYPGFGLGFSVIKKFACELNGRIKIKSSIGKGTTVSCVIPLKICE